MPAMIRILPLALILIGSSGCQPDPTPKWVGEWLGQNEDLVAPDLREQNPVLAGQLSRVHLTLRSDRSFELIRAGLPNEGNYSLTNETATLTITKVMGRSIDQLSDTEQKQQPPIKLTLNKDGTISMVDPADFGRDPVVLSKKESE